MSNLNHLIGHKFNVQFVVTEIINGDYPVKANALTLNGIQLAWYECFTKNGEYYVNKLPLTVFPEAPQIPWDECSWGMYAAMDADGDWWFYSQEPMLNSLDKCWVSSDDYYSHSCRIPDLNLRMDWAQSLIKRP